MSVREYTRKPVFIRAIQINKNVDVRDVIDFAESLGWSVRFSEEWESHHCLALEKESMGRYQLKTDCYIVDSGDGKVEVLSYIDFWSRYQGASCGR